MSLSSALRHNALSKILLFESAENIIVPLGTNSQVQPVYLPQTGLVPQPMGGFWFLDPHVMLQEKANMS